MARGWMTVGALLVGIFFVAILSGCPLKFEEESAANVAPTTFFERAPNDTTFINEIFFRWLGTDEDSDVVAFQYQLLETDEEYFFSDGVTGEILRSVDPPNEGPERVWTPRLTDNFAVFSEMDDGWYEFSARSIDAAGAPDPDPATKRFFVFFDDQPPVPTIVDTPQLKGVCGRLNGLPEITFVVDAFDTSRTGVITPRDRIEFSYRLRATSLVLCNSHQNDAFTEYRPMPADGEPLLVLPDRQAPPYNDLFDANCIWEFTFRTRDPAGNIATVFCAVRQTVR